MTSAGLTTTLDVYTIAGRFPVDAADVIHFANGIPGFEACRRFVLISASTLAPFTCLHGLDAGPSFLTVDPRLVVPDYYVPLGAAERARLGPDSDAPLLWLAVVRVDDAGTTANLRAPVVVHPGRMVGLQVMGADTPYSTAHPLAAG